MVSHIRKRRIWLWCIASFMVYACFNGLAMPIYPGGTSSESDAQGYRFLENFFSDLGMVRTYGGQPNTGSLLLFASAMGWMGTAFILFSATMPGYFTASRLERAASRVGSIGGVLAGLSCVGIAVTPWDLYLSAHLLFVYLLSMSFLLAVVGYFVAIWANRSYPNAYAAVFAVYTIILGVYMGLMFLGPDAGTSEGLVILAAGQKIVIYAGMACWFVQFLGAYQYHEQHHQERL